MGRKTNAPVVPIGWMDGGAVQSVADAVSLPVAAEEDDRVCGDNFRFGGGVRSIWSWSCGPHSVSFFPSHRVFHLRVSRLI